MFNNPHIMTESSVWQGGIKFVSTINKKLELQVG